jgi:hypothetical protein
VRPGSRTKVSILLVLPQTRHPERSASQIDRVTQRLARSRRTSAVLFHPCCSKLFNHRPRTGTADAQGSLNIMRTINSEFKDLAQT